MQGDQNDLKGSKTYPQICSQNTSQKISELINDYIIQTHQFLTPQEKKETDDIVTDLEHLLSQYIYNQYKTRYRQQTNAHARGINLVKLQPYGSYYLGTAGKTSDVDCIVLLPEYVNVESFMDLAQENLDSCTDATEVKYIKGRYKIISMIYKGVEFDLQPVYTSLSQVGELNPTNDIASIEPNIDTTFKQNFAAFTTNAKIRQYMQDKIDIFQLVNKILKLFVKKNLIDGNKVGYLGGVNISIMLAYVLYTANNLNFTAFDLLYAFFIFYGKINFGTETIAFERLDYREPSQNTPAISILTLTKPQINSTEKLNSSSVYIIQQTFLKGARQVELLKNIVEMKMKQMQPIDYRLVDFILTDVQIKTKKEENGQIKCKGKVSDNIEAIFKNKDFKKTGFLRIYFNLAGSENKYTEEDLQIAEEAIQPLLISRLYTPLEQLKLIEISQTSSKLKYVRPLPQWIDHNLLIGISLTDGDTIMITKKIKETFNKFISTLKGLQQLGQDTTQNLVNRLTLDSYSSKDCINLLQQQQDKEKQEQKENQ